MCRKNFRLVARLDVKGANLIKGVQFEGLRVIGKPNDFSLKYYEDGADEIFFLDTVASLYERNNLSSIVRAASDDLFVPLIVGGGIRKLDDAVIAFDSGADKVALNTSAIKNPLLIESIAKRFGSQAVVVSVEAKKRSNLSEWEAYTDCGRERTGRDVVKWVSQIAEHGAGEVLITSVDKDGTKSGPDLDLIDAVSSDIKLPLLVGGGISSFEDVQKIYNFGRVDGVVIGAALHHGIVNIEVLRKQCLSQGMVLRKR